VWVTVGQNQGVTNIAVRTSPQSWDAGSSWFLHRPKVGFNCLPAQCLYR
jgi:hypothetical protein